MEGSAAPAPPAQHGSRNLGILWGGLLGFTLAALLALGTWFLYLENKIELDAVAREDTAAARASQAAKAAAEEANAELAEQLAAAQEEVAAGNSQNLQGQANAQLGVGATSSSAAFPAPANAVNAPWFMSLSGNIACQLDSRGAICSIYQADFSLSAPGCYSTPYTIVADETGTRWDCTVVPVPNDSDGPVLEYSTASTSGNAACNSTSRGMSCWDTASGSSFALAKSGFMIGSNGVISETEYPWR